MKIAIATEGSQVSGHFGRCETFTIVEVENNTVKEKKLVNTEGNQHHALPIFLVNLGADVVISGGMGMGAYERLKQQSIEVYTGVQGTVDEVIEKFVQGQLQVSAAGVHQHHSHDHEHGHGHGHSCNCH